MTDVKAFPVKSSAYTSIRQALSNFHIGYDKVPVWRVRVEIGNRSFESVTTYKNEDSAKRAANAIGGRS